MRPSTPGIRVLILRLSHEQGTFTQSDIRLGSRGDSYYEYLMCVALDVPELINRQCHPLVRQKTILTDRKRHVA